MTNKHTNQKTTNPRKNENPSNKPIKKEKPTFILEEHPQPKGKCPNCKMDRCFRYYQGMPREYGICDHKNKCGYHSKPTKELSGSVVDQSTTSTKQTPKTVIYPDTAYLSEIMVNQNTNFHNFLLSLGVSKDHLIKWSVGGEKGRSSNPDGALTCFVYQNAERAVNVKKIRYLQTGKRDKSTQPFYLSSKTQKYERCLFGEHLLSQDKTICLVESEKSAVIASYSYPQFDWIAIGGAGGLTDKNIEALYNRKIYYLPDADKAGRDSSSLKKLKLYKLNFDVVDLYPERNDGGDIADFIVEGLRPEIVPTTVQQPENEKSKFMTDFLKPKKEHDKDSDSTRTVDVVVDYTKWIELLMSFGFRRFDLQKGHVYVRLDKQVISEVSITQIQDYFIDYLKKLPEKLGNGMTRAMVIEKFYKAPGSYFNNERLSLLKPDKKIEFNRDNKNEAFIYFNNGFVQVTKDGWNIHDYSSLKGFVWKDQLLNRQFKKIEFKGEIAASELPYFGQFMFNISGKDQQRFSALCSIVGYGLHSYFETKLKATVLTDSSISETAEGRTGKTLFMKGLAQLKRYVEIPGKDFDPANKHKYSMCNLDTQIIHLNDVRKYFDFETLYNDITEGICIDRKNQQPFTIWAKIFVSTNKTIKLEGASSRDRSIEFEFADHYSDKMSPQDEFKHWFFGDWKAEEWERFDNFMMYCIHHYFNLGLIIPKEINLSKRKLLDETCTEFIEFMQTQVDEKKINFGVKINRNTLHNSFKEAYPDIASDRYKNQIKVFTKWLRQFAKYTPGFADIRDKIDIGRSNNENWIIFRPESE